MSGFVGTKRSEIRAETNDHWKFVILIFVNGVRCAAVRDSGSAVSLVRRSLLAGQELIFSGRMDIQGVFGEARSIPVAEVVIHSPRFGNNQEFTEKVGIVDELPFECIIG